MFAFLVMVTVVSFTDLFGTCIKLANVSKYEKSKRAALYFQLPLSSIIFIWGATLLVNSL